MGVRRGRRTSIVMELGKLVDAFNCGWAFEDVGVHLCRVEVVVAKFRGM